MPQPFETKQIAILREVNAAAINISGRQRMLSQRIALLATRYVYEQAPALGDELSTLIALMARSHQGLLTGDPQLKLSGRLSAALRRIYFNPPIHLDQQVQDFIAAGDRLVALPLGDLQPHHGDLLHLQRAAAMPLLVGLDAIVTQYQREAEAQSRAVDRQQRKLYEQTRTAQLTAQVKATALQQALEELQLTQSQLIHAEKLSSLGQMMAGIAHEINNPLNFIHGNLDYAKAYFVDLTEALSFYAAHAPEVAAQLSEEFEDLDFIQEDFAKLLDSMQMGSTRIQEIVLGLRNFSRLDQNHRQIVDLHEGLENTLLILGHRLKAQGDRPKIQIYKYYHPVPLYLDCFSGKLNQVFMNLLSNAIDALEIALPQKPPGWQPQITLETQQLSNQVIEIKITDNGIGIPAEVGDRLMTPFFTTKPIGKGTGLGLSISRNIVVSDHQGTLHWSSQLGEGTTFILNLPSPQPAETMPPPCDPDSTRC